MIDIRLTLIILAGSLFGVQLGALGTTYVKEHMIKVVMGSIMLVVAVSRALAIPEYTNQLGLTNVADQSVQIMTNISFAIMVFALGMGAVIILISMFKAMRQKEPVVTEEKRKLEKAAK
jgi:hypothetical protein